MKRFILLLLVLTTIFALGAIPAMAQATYQRYVVRAWRYALQYCPKPLHHHAGSVRAQPERHRRRTRTPSTPAWCSTCQTAVAVASTRGRPQAASMTGDRPRMRAGLSTATFTPSCRAIRCSPSPRVSA